MFTDRTNKLNDKSHCPAHTTKPQGVPQTLVHGDFWSQNVVVTDERYVYFDWSDAAIAHPFFDVVFFLQDIEQELPDVPDVRVRLPKCGKKAPAILEELAVTVAASI